ncbi:MAG: TIGR00730 family Rossman fold protein [Bacteroidia bacterium]|nr:TIGR00730 family Rossman fold protein [Bacteroidia bacterium]
MDTTLKKEEHVFLEGPQARRKEGVFMLKVLVEFVKGFRKFHFLGPCVTVFGSARFTEEHKYYKMAEEIGGQLSELGYTVMTGGGPGIMEAANRGAKKAGGLSAGCNIVLPAEQIPNRYLDQWVSINYFFVRKVLLTKYSYAFVVMPGGYGTLDEFFESITLIQTGKMKKFPVVLIGRQFHKELYEHLLSLIKEGTIKEEDIGLFLFTDDIKEAVEHIKKYTLERFQLHPWHKPRWWLGEKLLRGI